MTTFNGFQSPNFTQIPNEYLDYTFSPDCDLSKVQMQIMNFVFRETFGWQDKHKILVFSATDIMALLNVKNRNQIVSALNGLVEDKKFLESIEVSKLSKKARSNIEKTVKKTLQPKQKIYRLNIIEGKRRPWDNIEEPHTDIKERKERFKGGIKNDTSIENDMTSGIKNDTTCHIKNDTTFKVESVGAVGSNYSLNKDLNKDLNKLEEEEKPSELISFLQSKEITLENAKVFENRLLEEGITGYTNDDVIEAIGLSLQDFVDRVCNSPYIWAVGKLKHLLDSKEKAKKQSKKLNQPKENLPNWFNEKQPKQEKKKNDADPTAKKKEIDEMLLKLNPKRAKNQNII